MHSASHRISSFSAHGLLMAGALAMIFPFIWMLLASFTAQSQIFDGGLLPQPSLAGAWENYTVALTTIPLLRFMANGLLVCGAILVLQILVAVPCGYALAKLTFPGHPLLFGAVLLGLLIPIQIPTIPLYIAIARLGLLDSYAALILPWAISVFAIFLFR